MEKIICSGVNELFNVKNIYCGATGYATDAIWVDKNSNAYQIIDWDYSDKKRKIVAKRFDEGNDTMVKLSIKSFEYFGLIPNDINIDSELIVLYDFLPKGKDYNIDGNIKTGQKYCWDLNNLKALQNAIDYYEHHKNFKQVLLLNKYLNKKYTEHLWRKVLAKDFSINTDKELIEWCEKNRNTGNKLGDKFGCICKNEMYNIYIDIQYNIEPIILNVGINLKTIFGNRRGWSVEHSYIF